MKIQGNWFAANSAALTPSVLHIRDKRYTLAVDTQEPTTGTLASLSVSDRLGNVERKITFEDGSVFATKDNDTVDLAFKGHKDSVGIVHAMESKWRWVSIAIVCIVCLSFSFFKWGLPAISNSIAHALPQKTNELIAGSTLDFLDKYLFEESKLDSARMEEIKTHFANNLVPLDGKNTAIHYTLHFRDWPDTPNAFALPSGDIILTDAFVEIAENQAQIDSVLLHEMGHVVHRHSLQMLIKATMVSAVVMLVTGDTNGIADLGIGLGSLFVSSHYSRGHETEADHYAFNQMLAAGIDPLAFAEIMENMNNSVKSLDGSADKTENTEENKGLASGYFSTHPMTSVRVEQAKQYSECFKRGEAVCALTK